MTNKATTKSLSEMHGLCAPQLTPPGSRGFLSQRQPMCPKLDSPPSLSTLSFWHFFFSRCVLQTWASPCLGPRHYELAGNCVLSENFKRLRTKPVTSPSVTSYKSKRLRPNLTTSPLVKAKLLKQHQELQSQRPRHGTPQRNKNIDCLFGAQALMLHTRQNRL